MPLGWIKDPAKFDPPDRDLSVGGAEGRQPGLYPGFSQFPVEGLKVRIQLPPATSPANCASAVEPRADGTFVLAGKAARIFWRDSNWMRNWVIGFTGGGASEPGAQGARVAAQIRCTERSDTPVAVAIVRPVQCVASSGGSVSVSVTTRSTSIGGNGGRPGSLSRRCAFPEATFRAFRTSAGRLSEPS
jgi:hypothetical protein